MPTDYDSTFKEIYEWVSSGLSDPVKGCRAAVTTEGTGGCSYSDHTDHVGDSLTTGTSPYLSAYSTTVIDAIKDGSVTYIPNAEIEIRELRRRVGEDLAVLTEICRDCLCGKIAPEERDGYLDEFERELERNYGLTINRPKDTEEESVD